MKPGAALAGALAAALAAVAAHAQDARALLNAAGRAGFEAYAAAGFNKAFAIDRQGRWAYHLSTGRSPAEVVAEALRRCSEGSRFPCQVVSLNDIDTTQRDPLSIPPVEPGTPAIGPLTPGPYYPIKGPRLAAGLLIWSHGVLTGADNTRSAPHGYINRLRDAGFDVYDFDRRWPDYRKDLATLQDAVKQARALGYRQVIVAGQSVGAWLSLESAAKGAPVDGVIAAAPARFGRNIGTPRRELNREELLPVLDRLRQRDLAVAMMFFNGDEYDPGGTSLRARDVLARGGKARTLLIDAPEGINGHGGAATVRFGLLYGDCLRDFLLTGQRRPPCAARNGG